jgi:hypothetical protein
MVTPVNPTSADGGTVVQSDRGFVRETETAPIYRTSNITYQRPSYFWGPVIAGTLFVISVFVLSWFLMLGCHVGVTSGGFVSLGWGAAWWFFVTAAIAYYCGGAIANSISLPMGAGWMKGLTIWGLSIPLVTLIGACVMGGSGMFGMIPAGQTIANHSASSLVTATSGYGINFGFMWAAFVTLLVGLVFAVFGSGSIASSDYERTTTTVAP